MSKPDFEGTQELRSSYQQHSEKQQEQAHAHAQTVSPAQQKALKKTKRNLQDRFHQKGLSISTSLQDELKKKKETIAQRNWPW